MRCKRIQVPVFTADLICTSYWIAVVSWMFVWSESRYGDIGERLILAVNPFTAGVYIMGFAIIATIVAFDNIAINTIMFLLYLFVACITIPAVMGASTWFGVVMFFLIRIAFIAGFFVILVMKLKTQSGNKQNNV